MHLLYGNFDFEHHLDRMVPSTLPTSLRRINAELAYCLVGIADANDLVWTLEPAEPEYRRHLEEIGLPSLRFVHDVGAVPAGIAVQPWGWSKHVQDWAAQNGWGGDHPDIEVVAAVNSREFSSALEQEWDVAPCLARTVRTIDEFCEAVACAAEQTAGWVVKANFGMSARQRVLGRGSPAGESALQWVRKRLIRDSAVYFEPWLDRIEEVGFQFTIPRQGDPVLEGVTPLLTDSQGTYRGSRLDGFVAQTDVLAIIERATRRIQQSGYFGPLGIDAMRYRTLEGTIRWRPLQDINARWTMGRLALELRRLLNPNTHASWLHLPFTGTAREIAERLCRIDTELPAGARVLRTSPLQVGGQPTYHGSLLVTALSAASLLESEAAVTSVFS